MIPWEQCASLLVSVIVLSASCVEGLIAPFVATISTSSSSSSSSSTSSVHRFEEYTIEHEVTAIQAKNAAVTIDPDSLFVPFSCQKCTDAEIRYCESANFVHDHCCCDRRFHEKLPYIPHTCYFGRQLCRPAIGHCDDYTKIRRCCCDRHALQHWKERSSASSLHVPAIKDVIFLFAVLALILQT